MSLDVEVARVIDTTPEEVFEAFISATWLARTGSATVS
jgi:uncharacterized protein YndB with AHSA1/START domain